MSRKGSGEPRRKDRVLQSGRYGIDGRNDGRQGIHGEGLLRGVLLFHDFPALG